MAADLSSIAQDAAAPRPRRHFLCTALCVAAFANALIPAVFFSDARLFGQTDPRYRALVASVVLAEYAIAFFLLLLHANVGFASGYAVATAAVVTLSSAALGVLMAYFAGWSWSALYGQPVILSGFGFAIVSNVVFLIAGIRYARAIHPRLHLGGFFLGIAACLALLLVYVHMFR
ncbi:MAG TPA: hypothetical protein VHX49_16440 [Candidatus Acidoferrales bacterium]|jgi:hypothetical protein|nr:hypothetical protein [Candidatus Acidoferrales bacterium]